MFYISKIQDDVRIPSKRSEDAGIDLYAYFNEPTLILPRSEVIIIPTGLILAFPKEYVLFIKERSSTGKIGMSTRMGVIDSGYRGEIKIGISNISNYDIIIDKTCSEIYREGNLVYYPYNKAIAQGVFLYTPNVVLKEILYDDIVKIESDRKNNMYGSTGK